MVDWGFNPLRITVAPVRIVCWVKFSSASDAVVASVEKLFTCDVSLLSSDDTAHILRCLTRARNQLDAVCAELASQAVRGDAQNGASWVARTTGVSKRDAKKMQDSSQAREAACGCESSQAW